MACPTLEIDRTETVCGTEVRVQIWRHGQHVYAYLLWDRGAIREYGFQCIKHCESAVREVFRRAIEDGRGLRDGCTLNGD